MPSNKDFINMPLQKFPLCIDLDGTLLNSDILYESSIKLILTKPWLIFSLLLWILKSKAWLKHKVAQRVDLAIPILPYNKAVLDFIREEYAQLSLIHI